MMRSIPQQKQIALLIGVSLFACGEAPCDSSIEVCVVCGDAFVEGAEECDDGNSFDNDVCTSDCKFAPPLCGNNLVQPGEACDDGNLIDADACDSQCQIVPAICADGALQIGEECDDANFNNGDGCDGNCTFTRCGNSFPTEGEECDDGNNLNGDDCNDDCTRSRCGDGKVGANEICDDGDFDDFDGCTISCQETCGNGLLEANEECDLGITNGVGQCSTICQICDDTIVDSSCLAQHDNILRTGSTDFITNARLFDLNNDGALDTITPVGFFLGNGDGTFQGIRTFGASVGGQRVAVADLNGDLFGEIVLTSGPEIMVLPSVDGLQFLPPRFFSAGGSTTFIEISDLNLDGRKDIITTTLDVSTNLVRLTTLLGNGDATFQSPIHSSLVGGGVDILTFGDVTGDAITDAVLLGDPIEVYAGSAAGTFSFLSLVTPSESLPNDLDLVDLNQDGSLDLVANCVNSSTIEFFFNDGSGAFTVGSVFNTADILGENYAQLTAADLDQDAAPELWAATPFGDQIRIFSLDYVTGTLLNAPPFSPGSISVSPFQSEVVMQARQLLVGDLNGQGGLDMVTLNAPQLEFPFATLSVITAP